MNFVIHNSPNLAVVPVSANVDSNITSWQDRDDGDLVRCALRGQLGAFDVLVGRYQRQATAMAFRLLNNRDDAMEVCQDAFLNAYEKLASLATPGRFGPWVLRIVSNLALNRRRARALRKAAPLETSDNQDERQTIDLTDPRAPTPLEQASAKDAQAILTQAITELPTMQRQAIELFCIQNMPQQDVAKLLGCSVEAVKWHVFTARKKLKEKLKDYL